MFKATQVLAADYVPSDLAALREAITQNYVVDENAYLAELSAMLPGDGASLERVTQRARTLVTKVRKESGSGDGIDAFLQEYSLDTQEGIILMCLAEALLRIPDAETADALIKDKLSGANWSSHFRKSDSTLVNASTWGLMLTGKIIKLDKKLDGNPANLLGRMVNKLGEPVVRSAMYAAMKIMGKQFVLGRDMKEALKASRKSREKGYTHTYDMLGESALTLADADKYFGDYQRAIEAVGNERISDGGPAPSISIKLSALHPRYDVANRERVLGEMCERLVGLVRLARDKDVAISIDAEEMDRLELSLDLFEQLYRSEANRGWGKLGMVVQAYSKRALPVLCWLTGLAREQGDLIPVRLVKGAYWDSELKYAQQAGLPGYPLFTRKAGTDISYLACARYLLSEPTRGFISPQFATHNANTVVSILEMAGDRQFEFQRLHGMGGGAAQRRTERASRPALPYLCAGGCPQGSAALPGAPLAGERGQHLLRPQAGGSQHPGRLPGRAPAAHPQALLQPGQRSHSAAGESVQRPQELQRRQHEHRLHPAPLLRQAERAGEQAVAGGPHRRWRDPQAQRSPRGVEPAGCEPASGQDPLGRRAGGGAGAGLGPCRLPALARDPGERACRLP